MCMYVLCLKHLRQCKLREIQKKVKNVQNHEECDIRFLQSVRNPNTFSQSNEFRVALESTFTSDCTFISAALPIDVGTPTQGETKL